MASKKTIYIEFKYPAEPWKIYDSTQVDKWASTQFNRMIAEHPNAEHRIEKR